MINKTTFPRKHCVYLECRQTNNSFQAVTMLKNLIQLREGDDIEYIMTHGSKMLTIVNIDGDKITFDNGIYVYCNPTETFNVFSME